MNLNDKPIIIEPNPIFKDERGSFSETYNSKLLKEKYGINEIFVQENISISKFSVVRGLHYQYNNPQGKLIYVIYGSIMDFAVDIREKSDTFGKVFKCMLSSYRGNQFYIPPGFAHGFVSLTEGSYIRYLCTTTYDKESDSTLLWNDDDLNINWEVSRPIVSQKDKNGIKFKDIKYF